MRFYLSFVLDKAGHVAPLKEEHEEREENVASVHRRDYFVLWFGTSYTGVYACTRAHNTSLQRPPDTVPSNIEHTVEQHMEDETTVALKIVEEAQS
jgi:hypothetical protein